MEFIKTLIFVTLALGLTMAFFETAATVWAPGPVMTTEAYSQMVKFDFNDRTLSLEQIRKIIDSAINVLLNEKKQKQIIEQKKEMRRRRLEKIKLSEERLDTYIKGRTV